MLPTLTAHTHRSSFTRHPSPRCTCNYSASGEKHALYRLQREVFTVEKINY